MGRSEATEDAAEANWEDWKQPKKVEATEEGAEATWEDRKQPKKVPKLTGKIESNRRRRRS